MMDTNPYESSKTEGAPPKHKPSSVKSLIVGTLVVLAILAAGALLLLPNVRMAREAARRASCANNLKQIALALHYYHDEYGSLPPAHTVDADGKPLHSWRTLILPYLEQKALYDQIDFSKPWNDPANQAVFNTRVKVYECLSNPDSKGKTQYLAVVAPNGCFPPTGVRTLDQITDGPGDTLMVVEVDHEDAVHWMEPRDADEQQILAFADEKSRPPHAEVRQVACADSRILALRRQDMKLDALRALITIDGGDGAAAEDAF